jgi:hypothetical protein
MRKWMVCVLLLLASVATAQTPAVKVLITTDSNPANGDDYIICPCDDEYQRAYVFAKSSGFSPPGVWIKTWGIQIDGVSGAGDDVDWQDDATLGSIWVIEDAGWDMDLPGVGWTDYSDLGVEIPESYVLLFAFWVRTLDGCDRLSETFTDLESLFYLGGYGTTIVASTCGPGDPARELTPDCSESYAECPTRLPYCVDSSYCESTYPERNLTCGECEDNGDCTPRVCRCGVCEWSFE